MAFTVTARSQTDNGTTASASQATGSFTPTADSLLIFGGHCEIDVPTGSRTLNTPTGGSLTYTAAEFYDGTGAPRWRNDGISDYRLNSGLWTAPVGGSPSSMTVTWDATNDAANGFYSVLAVDVTGHNVASPIVQSAKNLTADNANANSVSLAVTLGSAATVGNLVVVCFGAGADAGGGFVAPTYGGQSMTEVYNNNNAATQNGLWYRVVTGTESTNVITCTDIGQSTGNGTVFAVEVATGTPNWTIRYDYQVELT